MTRTTTRRQARATGPAIALATLLGGMAGMGGKAAGQMPPVPGKQTPGAVAPADATARQAEWSRRLCVLHNAERAKRGLALLTVDPRLTLAAWDQAAWCAKTDTLTHQGAGGSWPWDRITARGYRWAAASENAAQQPRPPANWPGPDPRTAEWAMTGWVASKGHLANILGPYTQMGGAVVDSPGGSRYWVVTFARPK